MKKCNIIRIPDFTLALLCTMQAHLSLKVNLSMIQRPAHFLEEIQYLQVVDFKVYERANFFKRQNDRS